MAATPPPSGGSGSGGFSGGSHGTVAAGTSSPLHLASPRFAALNRIDSQRVNRNVRQKNVIPPTPPPDPALKNVTGMAQNEDNIAVTGWNGSPCGDVLGTGDRYTRSIMECRPIKEGIGYLEVCPEVEHAPIYG